MLDGLELEHAKRWPTLGNLDEKIDLDLILPQTVLNFGEYQSKLQKLALYSDMGDIDSMQKMLDNQDIIDKKNVMLQPIFRDIKSLIRHMTYTPEYEIMRDYVSARNYVLNSGRGQADPKFADEKVEELRKLYGALLAKRRGEMSESLSLQLKTIKQRLDNVYELLELWNKYVHVIYMPDAELNFMKVLERLDIRPDNLAYKARMKEADITKRLNMLFGEDKDVDEKELANADYETVNEGSTTDTTSGLDQETVERKHRDYEALRGEDQDAENRSTLDAIKAGVAKSEALESKQEQVKEGIRSSDEEGEDQFNIDGIDPSIGDDFDLDEIESLDNIQGDGLESLISQQSKDEITSFKDISSNQDLYDTERTREQTAHAFGFSQTLIDDYAAALENRIDYGKKLTEEEATILSSDEEDIDFVGQKSLKEELAGLDRKIGELESMNLFGVGLDQTAEELAKGVAGKIKQDNMRTKKILKDLVAMAREIDPQGDSRDFTKRKAFNYYDPYNVESQLIEGSLIYDPNDNKNKASLVVAMHDSELSKMEEDVEKYGTLADKQTFGIIREQVKMLNAVKIVDPQILLRLYKLYRYKVTAPDVQKEI